MTMPKKIFSALKVSTLALVLSFGLSYVYAWTAPTVTPPNGNVAAPINTSTTAQTKAGDLTVGRLCLTGVCNASWPLGGGTNNYYNTYPTYNNTYPTAGVTSLTAGTGITLSPAGPNATGAVTVNATGGGGGVTSFNGATGAVTGVTSVNGQTGAVTVSGGGLGYGQTWQNFTGLRYNYSNYTNTTAQPILVTITTDCSICYSGNTRVYVGSTIVGTDSANSPGGPATYTFIVPSGGTYRIQMPNNTSAINWAELR